MDKWMKTIAIILAVSCMAGCAAKDIDSQAVETVGIESMESGDGWQNLSSSGDFTMADEQTERGEIKLNPELFDGHSIKIWNGKGNTLLALKEDTLYLYDVASARIKAKSEVQLSDIASFYPYRDGYFVIDQIIKGEPAGEALDDGTTMMAIENDDLEYWGIFYDDALNEIRKIALNDIVENPGPDTWAVSDDGSMLGYYNLWDGLNLYDLSSQKKQNLMGGIDGDINALFFEKGKRNMIFTGQTFQGNKTLASWGRIGMDGTGFENHIMEQDFGAAVGYRDGKLLIGDGSIFFKGGMAYVDSETGEVVYHTDIDRSLPVSGPYFSEDGTVFATAALDTQQMEIAIYNTTDFSLIYKEMIRDDREEMFYRSPQICLFPELQACIVCMGGHNDIPQKSVLLTY